MIIHNPGKPVQQIIIIAGMKNFFTNILENIGDLATTVVPVSGGVIPFNADLFLLESRYCILSGFSRHRGISFTHMIRLQPYYTAECIIMGDNIRQGKVNGGKHFLHSKIRLETSFHLSIQSISIALRSIPMKCGVTGQVFTLNFFEEAIQVSDFLLNDWVTILPDIFYNAVRSHLAGSS